VIALGMSYAPGPIRWRWPDVPDRARISVYAQGKDYHDTVKKALKALARWLVAEAAKAGPARGQGVRRYRAGHGKAAGRRRRGWAGRASTPIWSAASMVQLAVPGRDLHHRVGTRQPGRIIAAVVQRLPDAPARPRPSRALSLDARRCISYLTIEHKGPIPEEFRKGMGNRIYGCDDCLAVCPWNKFADQAAANKAFVGRAELAAPAIADLLALDDAAFREIFSGSPIKRIGRNRMVRNAAIAAGNSGDARLLGRFGLAKGAGRGTGGWG
jgi:epoxyqueuosine reductase